jgi:hypothetical protein
MKSLGNWVFYPHRSRESAISCERKLPNGGLHQAFSAMLRSFYVPRMEAGRSGLSGVSGCFVQLPNGVVSNTVALQRFQMS